jgi:hypothetical protein
MSISAALSLSYRSPPVTPIQSSPLDAISSISSQAALHMFLLQFLISAKTLTGEMSLALEISTTRAWRPPRHGLLSRWKGLVMASDGGIGYHNFLPSITLKVTKSLGSGCLQPLTNPIAFPAFTAQPSTGPRSSHILVPPYVRRVVCCRLSF